MIKKLLLPLLGVAVVASFLVMSPHFTPVAHAVDLTMQQGADSAKGSGQPVDLFGNSGIFTKITNVMLFIVGAVSVIMIIIGGLRYVISGGNSANVTAAKNTILYAVVGIIVALLGFAIVNFVITSFSPTGTDGGSSSGF